MTRRRPTVLPPGPWIATFREFVRANGGKLPEPTARLVETHVNWHVNALLVDPRLDARGREAVRSVFLSVGPSSGPARTEPPPARRKERPHGASEESEDQSEDAAQP